MSDSLAGFPVLATARLRLKPLTAADAPELRAITDDAAIIASIDFLRAPFTLADAEALIHGAGDGRDCFIGVRHGEALIGVVGAHLHADGRIEFGYWLGSAWHGRGFATEAAAAVIAALRGRFPGRRIVAECHPANRASWRVLEKLGLRATGAAGQRSGRRVLELP